MKIIVCGGRDYKDRNALFLALDCVHSKRTVTELAHGGATGADALAGEWAARRNIPVRVFHAEWDKHGKFAGPIRNLEMLVSMDPDGVVAFPGGKGTANMIMLAEQNGYKVWRPYLNATKP